MTDAAGLYRAVMAVDPPAALGDDELARFADLWGHPGMGRRERRWVTLVCLGSATDDEALAAHVYAALASGDAVIEELLEFVLHFAVYGGWPRASRMEQVLRDEWARWHRERGEEPPAWPVLANETLGDDDWERRLQRGEQEFADVNLVPAPARNTPYQQAGILNFVFGHLWLRPGLSRRDRRFVTVPCVALALAPLPIQSHVGSALHSGDVTRPEMDELIRHVGAYAGEEYAEVLRRAVADDWLGGLLGRR